MLFALDADLLGHCTLHLKKHDHSYLLRAIWLGLSLVTVNFRLKNADKSGRCLCVCERVIGSVLNGCNVALITADRLHLL